MKEDGQEGQETKPIELGVVEAFRLVAPGGLRDGELTPHWGGRLFRHGLWLFRGVHGVSPLLDVEMWRSEGAHRSQGGERPSSEGKVRPRSGIEMMRARNEAIGPRIRADWQSRFV